MQDRQAIEARKEQLERTIAYMEAQKRSGAGFDADSALRYFLDNYNGRILNHGNHSLPASFAIAEAFFARPKALVGLALLPEQDYLLRFSDFLDYSTAAGSPSAKSTRRIASKIGSSTT